MVLIPEEFEDLAYCLRRQIDLFPGHEKFLSKRFAGASASELGFGNEVASLVRRISGESLDRVWESYDWLSAIVREEELFFRRNGRYRLSTFEEAQAQVYDNREYMAKYMRGLLATQLWWSNHTRTLQYFRDRFLPLNPPGFTHLEVGPGHGLLLWLAANVANLGSCEGWDISDASLTLTREALDRMGVDAGRVHLRKVNLFEAPASGFQSIAFSEVLEHLTDPLAALKALRDLLVPGGRLFVHAPVNSPAPDHLYLFRTPEEVRDLLIEAGFEIEDTQFEPATGLTLDRARKIEATISAAIIASRPE